MAANAVNAQLGDEADKDGFPRFRVIVNDAIYKERTKHVYVVHCQHCQAECDRADLPLRKIRPPAAARALMGAPDLMEVWKCKHCHKDSRLELCDVEDRHLSEPYYCGAVPSPPVRKPGLRGRTQYLTEFRAWAAQYIVEIEAGAAAYRQEYWQREEDDGLDFSGPSR